MGDASSAAAEEELARLREAADSDRRSAAFWALLLRMWAPCSAAATAAAAVGKSLLHHSRAMLCPSESQHMEHDSLRVHVPQHAVPGSGINTGHLLLEAALAGCLLRTKADEPGGPGMPAGPEVVAVW